MHSERRAQASKLLSAVARRMNNPRLATLAVRVRLDAFTRVAQSFMEVRPINIPMALRCFSLCRGCLGNAGIRQNAHQTHKSILGAYDFAKP